jgi:DNA-binding GntR family transcriptional regulator
MEKGFMGWPEEGACSTARRSPGRAAERMTPMAARSEAELLAAAREGDGEALEALLARHERQVYRFGLRMCGSESDARGVGIEM